MTSAGVLLLLYPKDGELRILLNKRTNRVEHHKGEISFPGGARDPEDESLLDTALRETQEEMGILRQDVDIICPLSQVSTRSGFAISPFVGTIPPGYPFASSNLEVAEILEVPLAGLLNPANLQERVSIRDDVPVVELAYAYGEHLIWGATARILTQFLGLVAPAMR